MNSSRLATARAIISENARLGSLSFRDLAALDGLAPLLLAPRCFPRPLPFPDAVDDS
jgi:hypothetical protein